jgi:hypothetical protein
MSKTRRAPRQATRNRPSSENGHDRVLELPLSSITPSPENDELYHPCSSSDPDILALADSIKEHGVKEPLVVTLDNYILSGHRRYLAAQVAGLHVVPVRYEQNQRIAKHERFVVLRRESNPQRAKSFDEVLREEVVSANPSEAYQSLVEHRQEASRVEVSKIRIVGTKHRCKITAAKQPMLDAVLAVLEARRRFWPLTVRTIHYAILNDPPRKHVKKPDSIYDNTIQSYKNLDDLLIRTRLAGVIPFEAIGDETRPVTTWNVYGNPGQFIGEQLQGFLKGYWRDLMQSQPNHIEIVGEKNTVDPIIREVAMKYCIPVTTGRGYCSLPPRYEMAQRFQRSGKNTLVLLILSDFDPEGEDIAHSFSRSMRDDFDVNDIHPVKVALTAEQVVEHDLPPLMKAKSKSSRIKKFVDAYGDDVFELEAVSPETLQGMLRDAIDSVIDTEMFNEELAAEVDDAAFLEGVRLKVNGTLKKVIEE